MPASSPREALEGRLAALRADPAERAALEAKVAEYSNEASKQVAGRSRSSAHSRGSLQRTPSRGGSVSPDSTASLPTARSRAPTPSNEAFPDPVGGWKSFTKDMAPPLKFGFESEGARRREHAARATTPLLGAQEKPPGSTHSERDTECLVELIHSPLPGTLRPTPRLARGVSWQPATRQRAWTTCRLAPGPVARPTSTCLACAAVSAASSCGGAVGGAVGSGGGGVGGGLAAAKGERSGASIRGGSATLALGGRGTASAARRGAAPVRLSSRAYRALADAAPALTDEHFSKLAAVTGARLAGQVRARDRFDRALPPAEFRAQRSMISTRLETVSGIRH